MIIAVDLDNTINDFAKAWLAILNKRHKLRVGYDDLKNYEMEKNFPMLTPVQVDSVLGSPKFWYAAMKPQPESVNILKHLSMHHEIYIVTARAWHQHQAVQFIQPWHDERKWGTYACETWNEIYSLISDLDEGGLYPGRANRS